MTVLALRLAAPLQSWGAASRFVRRYTHMEPTKSGIVGLIAAAQGRRRTDPIEDLTRLTLGVRVDQPGRLVRDFQTARPDVGKPLPLSYRFYLGDAVFLALVEADDELLAGIDEALRQPAFPLYLGRRSCPPAGPINLGLRDGDIASALKDEPWLASRWYRNKHHRGQPQVRLITVSDCQPGDEGAETVRDEPVTFDPDHRQYHWRSIRRGWVEVANPDAASAVDSHDPMTA